MHVVDSSITALPFWILLCQINFLGVHFQGQGCCVTMINEEGINVDAYIPRKWYAAPQRSLFPPYVSFSITLVTSAFRAALC